MTQVHADYPLGTTDGSNTWLMPVNPISFLHIGISGLTAAAAVSDTATDLMAVLQSIQVRHRGMQLWSGSAMDVYRMAKILTGRGSFLRNPASADNSRRYVGVLIPFGRKLFDPMEALPSTMKGELDLYMSWDAVTTKYDNIVLDIHACEIFDAQPAKFLRCTTMSDTPAATGDKDYDLPRAAEILGVGVFATSSYPTSATPTVTHLKLLRNGQDRGYPSLSFEMARELAGYRSGQGMGDATFAVIENTAGSYAQNATSSSRLLTDDPMRDFGYIDLDPTNDGLHKMETSNASDFKLRVTFGATEAVRLMPVEHYTPELLSPRKR
jgi:hypothetical protein